VVWPYSISRQALKYALDKTFFVQINGSGLGCSILAGERGLLFNENGNPVFPPLRICLWHENFLDSRFRGNDILHLTGLILTPE